MAVPSREHALPEHASSAGASSDALLDGVFEHAGVGLCLVDPAGCVRKANARWLAAVGREAADVLGRELWDVLPESPPAVRELHARAQAGEVVELPEQPRAARGREVWYGGRLSPVPFPEGTGVLITAWDATAAKRVEQAILEEHAQLRRHVASTPLALVEWDGDYRVVGYSARAEEMFGYAPAEVLGKRIDEIPWVPEEDWPSVRAVMRDMRTAARPTNVNANRNVHKDGTVIHCEWYNSALHDASGRLVSLLSLVLDVTDRKRAADALRASEARAELVARFPEENPDPVLRLSDRLTVLYANPAARAALAPVGLESGAPAPPALSELAEHARRDGTAQGELESGRVVYATSAVRVGTEVNVYAQDITARKAAEEGLRAANAQLREADRRKDEFLAMLSHELRNPLAPIRNAVAILDRASPTGQQAVRAKAVIGRQVQHLARLVDDLLDVTRIARGKITLRREPLDLVAVVNRAAEDHRPLMYERGVSLSIELPSAPTWVNGDATRLTQVLGNLLQNAAKFTEQGGRVTVSLVAGEGTVEVRVHDTGVGIAPELLGRVFEAFVQSDQSLARSQGGLGLGLALVRGIAELHGGSVRAESAGPGQGSTFVVRLPALAIADARAERTGAAATAQPRRVLVVDDNHDAADSLAVILALAGHTVEVAYDGPSAIEKARASRSEFVLCDLGLPGMTGYDVARQLRALRVTSGARLIAVSGYARPEDVERSREAGFDGHVAKPPDPDELARLLS